MTDVDAMMEEIYRRAERKFSTKSGMANWMNSFKNGGSKSAYEDAAVELSKSVYLASEIESDLNKVDNLDDAEVLINKVDSIDYGPLRDEVYSEVQARYEVYQEDEVEKQEMEIATLEAYKQAYNEAQTVEERRQAEADLRAYNAKVLGGIKSGEKRRASSAFRRVFDI